jgi:prepilin-type N-terminal cleavage/methylation domain-containing protein
MIGDSLRRNKLITKNKKGFTLIEVLVSVTLFVVIMMAVTNIFKMVIDAQRNAIAAQNVQESLKYFFEITGKEMRMAVKNNGDCDPSKVPVGSVFGLAENSYGDTLYFKNYLGECVQYFLEKDYHDVLRFAVSREQEGVRQVDFISPEKISIDSLHFVVRAGGSSYIYQPQVTMNMSASALSSSKFQADMTLQTTVSSRYYKEN